LVQADLSCVTVLITMGVLLGRLTPVQFLVLAFLETSLTVLLEHLLYNVLYVLKCIFHLQMNSAEYVADFN
jgi:hypothetical protein